MTLLGNTTLGIDVGQLTVGGVISGAFDINKAGAGTLILSGANAYLGRVRGRRVELDDGGVLTAADALRADAPVLAVVPAHAVALHREQPRGSARNTWPVVVRELTAAGSRVRVRCEGNPSVVAEVTPDAVADLRLREDDHEVWASVKATEVTVVLL